MWKSGIRLRQRSSVVSSSVSATFRADAARFVWVSGTSFGRLVVPEVCNNNATSSASGSGSGAGAPREERPGNANDPSFSDRTSITLIPNAAATSRAGVSMSSSTTSIRGARSVSEKRNSSSVYFGLSGAATVCAMVPSTIDAIPGPFGMTIATRSRRSAPASVRWAPIEATWATSDAYPTVGEPGARIAGLSGASRACRLKPATALYLPASGDSWVI